jgi:hypothetical protein
MGGTCFRRAIFFFPLSPSPSSLTLVEVARDGPSQPQLQSVGNSFCLTTTLIKNHNWSMAEDVPDTAMSWRSLCTKEPMTRDEGNDARRGFSCCGMTAGPRNSSRQNGALASLWDRHACLSVPNSDHLPIFQSVSRRIRVQLAFPACGSATMWRRYAQLGKLSGDH